MRSISSPSCVSVLGSLNVCQMLTFACGAGKHQQMCTYASVSMSKGSLTVPLVAAAAANA